MHCEMRVSCVQALVEATGSGEGGMTDVVNRLKPMFTCICGCGAEGTKVRKNGHLVRCDPSGCVSCRNGRNRRTGQAKQRQARKALRVPASKHAGRLGNEENWLGELRVEVKSGAQCKPAATRFLKDEGQSDASRPVGDVRPFVNVLMPDGMSDGIFQCRTSQLERVAVALAHHFGLFEDGAA